MGLEERVFELVDQKFKNDKEFALAIGVKPQRVSEWRQRISKSYNKYLPQIASVLGTSLEYLLTGSQPQLAAPADLSEEDREILRQIHDRPGMRIMFSVTSKATDEDIERAARVVEALLQKNQE